MGETLWTVATWAVRVVVVLAITVGYWYAMGYRSDGYRCRRW